MVRAMVIVDVQNDFCEGGSLAVAGGSKVAYAIANAVSYYRSGKSKYLDYIVATKDFHQGDNSNGGHFDEWPVHCVQDTTGANFHPGIEEIKNDLDAVFYKGQGRPDYSGFQGVAPTSDLGEKPGISLDKWLRNHKVTDLSIVGIATDHCVYETAMDAIHLGYKVDVPYHLTVAVGGQQAVESTIKRIYNAQGLVERLV